MPSLKRIVEFDELKKLVEKLQEEGKTVALCHGCFDLVHPGHVRHFKEAAKQADVLIVTVTPDRFVNKGPGRPLFKEALRLEQLASLRMIHYVALNKWPTSIETITELHPNIYIKGGEYEDHSKDISGNIKREVDAVEAYGGKVYYTHDIVFSSTKLINQNFALLPETAQNYVKQLRSEYSSDDLEALIERFAELKVVVLGDTIIDEYCYCVPMGRVEKAPIISVRYVKEERYAGGILAIANHAAQFAKNVTLITVVGDRDDHDSFARTKIDSKIGSHLLVRKESHTVTKRRFLTSNNQKLFEVGFLKNDPIDSELEQEVIETLRSVLSDADLLIIGDFGHGLLTPKIIEFAIKQNVPICVNAQTNSSNFGFNYITRYARADFLSIDENEIRLPFQTKVGPIDPLIEKLTEAIHCRQINVTLGPSGSVFYSNGAFHRAPALATQIVDTVGAGDAVFTLTALAWRSGFPAEIMPFLGNMVGALAVAIIGNKEPVTKSALIKSVRGLLA